MSKKKHKNINQRTTYLNYVDAELDYNFVIIYNGDSKEYECYIDTHRLKFHPFATIFTILHRFYTELNKTLRESDIKHKFVTDDLSGSIDAITYNKMQKECNTLSDFLYKMIDIKEHLADKDELPLITNSIGRTSFALGELIGNYSMALHEEDYNKLKSKYPNIEDIHQTAYRVIEKNLPLFSTADSDIDIGSKSTIYDSLKLPYDLILCKEPTFSKKYATANHVDENAYDFICSIPYNKFKELLSDVPAYKINSDFSSNLTVFIEYGEYHLPLFINCVKIMPELSNGFDYEISIRLIGTQYITRKSILKTKISNINNYSAELYYSILYNSNTGELYGNTFSEFCNFCDINHSFLDTKVDEAGKRFYCNRPCDCLLKYGKYQPLNFINVLGYIQYVLENRHRISKLKEYNRSTDDNGLGVQTLSPAMYTETSNSIKWISIKEFHKYEKESNKNNGVTGTHKSPCEHYRASHTRVLKNGKIITVKDSIVNKGKTDIKPIYSIK